TFALYTDGLIEAPDTDPANGLAQQLAQHCPRNLDRRIDALPHHARPTAHYTDHIAMLLLRTGPPPA
ncbi:SpoIIE family protein phosphatase, partial [Streptomyces avermitilis]